MKSTVTKKTAVAKVEEKKEIEVVPQSWGFDAPVRTEDIVLPSLVLMQAMSPPVVEGRAVPGDIMSFPSGKILGNKESPVTVQPVMELPKTWGIYVTPPRGKKPQFKEYLPFAGNESLAYEEDTKEGVITRVETYNYFVLVPGEELPHKISFKKSSKFVGKQIYTHLVLCQKSGLAPASYLLNIKSKKQTHEDNTFFVYELLADKKKVEASETVDAYKWYQSIKKNSFKVAEDTHLEEPEQKSEADVKY